ncbi:MAG TPA: hypothetical protein VJ689_10135 [Gaiellaceae bacterium]|nr:hypothetical protein [Gaiellaceae bacterium]
MIRLHRLIDRGRRHPVVGPLVVLLVVLLVALTMLHEGHEGLAGEIGVLCVGIAVLLVTAAALAPVARFTSLVAAALPARAPPSVPAEVPSFGFGTPSSLPLRL